MVFVLPLLRQGPQFTILLGAAFSSPFFSFPPSPSSLLPSFLLFFRLSFSLLLLYECMQVLKDWHLALGVLVSVLIDVLILLIYTIVEGAWGDLNAIRVSNREQPTNIVGVG